MLDNPKRQYYLQLRQRVDTYCKDLRKKLQVFPNKIMRGASHLDIPDDEMMYYKNNSYSLKVQVKDCLKIYKFLQKKTKVNEYEKYFSIYKKECQGKKNVEEYKTAYNTAEMELVKEFNAQRDLLYRAVTIMKALTNYLKKKDGKEEDNKENVQSVEEYVNDITEACKSPLEARRFIKYVERVAKRYDANYFIVSDGASATHNDNNEAIRYCRNALKEWESKNGYNPDEDWNNNINDFSNYRNNSLTILMNLNTKLNLYEYGLPVNGVITDVTSGEYYDKNYKSLSPKEFDTYKGGICWDYVRYQDAYLTKKRVRHVNYFIIDPHTFQTHTITISKVNKKYYYIESSFKKYCGVYESNNVKNIFSFVTHNMRISNYNIFRITEFPKDHTSSNTYIRFMTDLSKMVLQGKTKNLKYIKLKNLQKPVELPKDTRNIEEYVNDVNDMNLHFTEKEKEVMNHHFISTGFTFESYMPYEDINIVPHKSVNKLSLDSTHDNVTRLYGRPLKMKFVRGQQYEDKYTDMKIQYSTLTEKIFYVKANLGEKIIINKRPYQNDYKKLISSLDLIKIAIGTYANPDLGLIFVKGKFKSEFVTVYVTNDPALLRILNLMVNNYGRHYVTFLELKSLLMVFNRNLRYYYNRDVKKMRKYDYDYSHKIDKYLWLEENFEKILKLVEFSTNIYIH